METFLKPEIIVPILLNVVLAATTIFYLLETRSMRRAMAHQVDVARRQHFVTTAPFVYAAQIDGVPETDSIRIKINNPSEKLARDVKYVIFDSSRKTFRAPDRSQVVIRPNGDASVTLLAAPFTKSEVEKKLQGFYGIPTIDKSILTEGSASYVLLLYTDVEGSVYTVKAHITRDEESGAFARERSRFKKIFDPRG